MHPLDKLLPPISIADVNVVVGGEGNDVNVANDSVRNNTLIDISGLHDNRLGINGLHDNHTNRQ